MTLVTLSPMRHHFAALLGLALATALLNAGAVAAAAAPTVPTLTLLSGDGVFDFGSSRDPQSRTFQFAIQPRLPSGQRIVVRPVDLLSGGHAIPARQMTIGKRVLAQRRLLRIVVRVDPGDAEPGEYTGQLPIAAAGRVVDKVELKATFRSRIWTGWFTTFLALGAILVGASAGAILKWLSDTGAKLQALENRYERVIALLGSSRLPNGLKQRLVSIQASLASQDAAQAEAQLAQVVDSQLDAVVRIGADFERLSTRVEAQRRTIERLKATEEDALLGVVDRETQALAETLDASWPDPAAGQADRAALAGGIGLYDFFLVVYEKEERRDALRPAIIDFARGDFDSAKKKIDAADVPQEMLAQTLQVSGDVVGVLAYLAADKAWSGFNEFRRTRRRKSRTAEEAPRPPDTSPPRRKTRLPVRYAGLISGSIIALIVTLVGMTVLYSPKDTFGGAEDWLTLILWGFGVQLSGFSVAQLGGRALGSGPKIADVPRT